MAGPRLRFDDPAIASQTVTGLYDARDPEGFARAVAAAFGLETERAGDEIVLRAENTGR